MIFSTASAGIALLVHHAAATVTAETTDRIGVVMTDRTTDGTTIGINETVITDGINYIIKGAALAAPYLYIFFSNKFSLLNDFTLPSFFVCDLLFVSLSLFYKPSHIIT